jgi:hypothetical protein
MIDSFDYRLSNFHPHDQMMITYAPALNNNNNNNNTQLVTRHKSINIKMMNHRRDSLTKLLWRGSNMKQPVYINSFV